MQNLGLNLGRIGLRLYAAVPAFQLLSALRLESRQAPAVHYSGAEYSLSPP
jgi:hypothetical protein